MNSWGKRSQDRKRAAVAFMMAGLSFISLIAAFTGSASATVTPGSTGTLVQSDISVHENSSAIPVFGIGARSSTGADTLVRTTFNVISRAAAFSMSDLEPISTDMTSAGIGVFRDTGTVDDQLDPSDTALSISSFSASTGSSPWTVRLNISSEPVPTSISGSYQWIVVMRTSSTIGQSDGFQLEVASGGIVFSDGTTMPSSATRTGTMSCLFTNAHFYGSGQYIPIGEDAAPVDTVAVQAYSLFSGRSQIESISTITVELRSGSGFDPWTDLKAVSTAGNSGLRVYFDNGGSSADVWNPNDDTRLVSTSVTVTNVTSPAVLWRIKMDFPTSGSSRPWVPTSSTGSHDLFLVVSSSNSISHSDIFRTVVNPWSIELTGLDGKVNSILPSTNRSRDVKADTRAPDLTGAAFTVLSDRGYFYDKDTDLSGRDEVFYNSVSGEGLGQTLRVMFQSFTEENFMRLRGETAFGQTPTSTDPLTPTLAYVVTVTPPNNPVTLTLEDTLGHETSWDVYITEDNSPPRVSGLSMSDPSPYIHTDISVRQMLFRTLMVSPHPFHIAGSASEPSQESGLDQVQYSFEASLHSSPPADDTPASFNGTYQVSSISTAVGTPIFVDLYDNVQNRNRLQFNYSQVSTRPSVTMVTPTTLGQSVSGLYRVTARVSTPAPTLKVEFSTDGSTGPVQMAYGGTSGGLETYYYDWDTVTETEGSTAIVVKATDRTGGIGYNTTYWVDVRNYPLWAYFENLAEGDSRAGRQTLILRVSSYCKSVQLYVDDELVDGYQGAPPSNGRINLDLDTRQFNEGTHVVKAYLQGFGGRSLEVIVKAVFDNSLPYLRNAWVDYPGTQTASDVGDEVRVKAVVSDNVSGLESQTVFASAIGGSSNQQLYDDGAHDDGQPGDGIFATDLITVNAAWAYHTIRLEVRDRASNRLQRNILVPVDTNSPSVEANWIKYPVGQGAAKPGDDIQVMARVSDLTAPVYITLVLDNSGSMQSSGSMGDLQRAAKVFVNSTRRIDFLSIYKFRYNGEDGVYGPPGSPKRILNFTLMDDDGKALARALIDGLEANAGTPIWDSIGEALDYTLNYGLSSPVLVVFTDGADDYSREWGDEFGDPIRYEEGSSIYCPWHSYTQNRWVSYHWGKYPDQGYRDNETNEWVSNGTGKYYWVENFINGTRRGLLGAPVPIFTIGLALEHHDPPDEPARTTDPVRYEHDDTYAYWEGESGTPEYNLWRVASTSSGGEYFHAPSSTELEMVFKEISKSIYSGNEPARVVTVRATVPLDQTLEWLLYDDGLHSDGAPGDGTYGSEVIEVPVVPLDRREVLISALDWANNSAGGSMELVLDPMAPRITSILVDYGPNRTASSDWEPFIIRVEVSDMGSSVSRITAEALELGFLQTIILNDTGRGNDLVQGDGIWSSMDILPSTGNVPSMKYPVNLLALDQAGNEAEGLVYVSVVNDRYAPVVQMVHPRPGGFIRGNDVVSAEVAEDGVLSYVKYTLKDLNGTQLMSGFLERQIGDLYSAKVDSTNTPEGIYIFELVASDSAGRKGSSGLMAVGVDNNDPSFYLDSPTNGSSASGVVMFSYNAYDTYLDDVYFNVDGSTFNPVGAGMNTSNYSEGFHVVVVRAVDLGGRYRSVRLELYFDNTVALVSLIAPADAVAVNGTVYVEVQASDPGGLRSVEGRVYAWGNRTGPEPPRPGERPVATVRLAGPKGGIVLSGQYEGYIDTRGLPDGKYLLTGTAVDRSGTEGHDPIYLPVDNSAPELILAYPKDGSAITGMFTPQVQVNDPFLVDANFNFNGRDYPITTSIDLNEVPEGTYAMRFFALDSSFRSTVRTITVFVDRSSPVVRIISPADRTSIDGELVVLARVQEAAGVKIAYLNIDGFTVAFGEPFGTGDIYSFRVDFSGFNMSDHRVEAVVEDMAGRVGRSSPISIYNKMLDTDGDGVSDPYDDAPYDPRVSGDIDRDGFGSKFDLDDDGDGIEDQFEPQNQSLDISGSPKGMTFSMDPTEWRDTDADGIGDNSDPDIDGDGLPNGKDAFPLNATEWGDVDGDGLGDNIDPDRDGDGVRNGKDKFPYDPSEWKDTDNDKVGDNADNDDDNDGVPDSKDAFPDNRWRRYHWEPYLLMLGGALLCTLVLISGFIFRERLERGLVASWEHGGLRDARMEMRAAYIRLSQTLDRKKVAEKGPMDRPGKGPRRHPRDHKEKVIEDGTKGYRIRWERP